MADGQAKILYIAGWDRSGSTILDQILGQLPGFFSVGELVDLWGRGPDALCGCGLALRACQVWQEIFLQAYGETPDTFDFAACERYRQRCARLRHLLLLPSSRLRGLLKRSLAPYLALTAKLYRAIGSVTGAKVIVDSSKQPSHAYALTLAGMAPPYVIHLIRDPRGCAYSYQVSKVHRDPAIGHMPLIGPARSSLHWILANQATEALWSDQPGRYFPLRYEDFTKRPARALQRIITFVGEPVAPPLLGASQRSVFLRPAHAVSGNAARFATGVIELKCDEKWKQEMKQSHKFVVTALTGFVLGRYGYDYKRARRNYTQIDHSLGA
jgi:hypothetical protein